MGVAVAFLLALMSASAAGGDQIRSDVDCPSGPDVAARLQPMLGEDAPSPATLSITREAKALTLALSDAAGSIVDTRTWPANGDCAAAAEALAVVGAAWLGELPPVRNTVAAPALPSSQTDITEPATAPRQPAWLTVVVGVGESSPISRIAPSGIVWVKPTLALELLARPSAASRGFAGLAIFANLPREHTYSFGVPDNWYRLSAGPEVGIKDEIDPFSVMASGGVSAGALVARGVIDGLTPPTTVFFDVGAFADLRAGIPLGSGDARWDLWMSVHGRASLRSTLVDYNNHPPNPDKRNDVALLLGGDYSWPW